MKRILLIIAAAAITYAGTAQHASQAAVYAQDTKIFNGRLVDASNNQRIPFATVWMRGTSISVVSNGEGDFSLKVPAEFPIDSIYVKHMGYRQQALLMAPNPDDRVNIRLTQSAINIEGITVNPSEPLRILRTALNIVRSNYPITPQRMVGFYREMIMKNNRYVSVVEAIPDIYKASTISAGGDQIRLYKGRRSYDDTRVDTLIMKYRGGLGTALNLDIAKRHDMVFVHPDSIARYYALTMEETTEIQGRPQYVIAFNQINYVDKPMLYRGRIYIDRESMAISRCEYNMNVEEHADAYRAFVVSLPPRYRISMLESKVIVDYIYNNGVWDYNYVNLEFVARVRSDKRRFNARYTIISELVITDRGSADVEKFPSKERLKTNDLVFDKIIDYDDDGFWEGYNAIEPEQTIENAVRRLNRNVRVDDIR